MDRLLWALHPDRAIHPWHRCADAALANFERPRGQITTLSAFADVVVVFYWHVLGHLLGLGAPLQLSTKAAWSAVREILQKTYGPAGHVAAFEMTRTGVNGGLPAVLRTIANKMAERASREEIHRQVTGFWNLLSTAGWLATGPLLLQRLQALLSPELAIEIAARLQADPPAFLEELPQLLLDFEQRMPLP